MFSTDLKKISCSFAEYNIFKNLRCCETAVAN